jgi:hypothetical protein
MTNVGICDTLFVYVRSEGSGMAKDQKPADQMEAFSKDAMAHAHQAVDTYFDFLKKSVSSFPSGGTELGEKLKDQSVRNITAVHDLVKRLSQAKDFEEALRIQTDFVQSQFEVFAEQMRSLGEVYSKEAASGVKMPFKSSLD